MRQDVAQDLREGRGELLPGQVAVLVQDGARGVSHEIFWVTSVPEGGPMWR